MNGESWAQAFSEPILGGVGEGAGWEYELETECATHGWQKYVIVCAEDRAPREDEMYQICPLCIHRPEGKVLSIRRVGHSTG